jgi:ABC-type transport system involved in multi-copper enzyme maturation permease subunit
MKNILLLIVGILLILNGFGNIVDDSRVLTYDITSILSGLGFIIVSRTYKTRR